MADIAKGMVTEKRSIKDMELREITLFGILVILVTIFSFLAPNFFKLHNFMNLGMYSASMAITAAGMTFVIIAGGIDISVGAIMSCCGILTANLLLSTQNVAIAVSGGILLGILIGFFNGILVTKLKVEAIIITIGTMSILRGTVYLISQGRMVSYKRVSAFDYFGPERLGGILPMALLIMLSVYIIGGFVLSKLKFGRHVYAIGSNAISARLAGIKVNVVYVTVFIISGLCAAISGIVLTSLLGAGMPKIGFGKEIDIIAATILGGAAVRGGRGRLIGTLVGVFIIGVVGNALTQLGLITFWQDIFKGAILILAVYFDQIREMRALK